VKVFRGTGGICQLAQHEEFPNIFTSAVCRSSGGAWSGGHDLVLYTFVLSDLLERAYIHTHACVVVSMVGIAPTLFYAQLSLHHCYQDEFCTSCAMVVRFWRKLQV
jgi:hypothetical protein